MDRNVSTIDFTQKSLVGPLKPFIKLYTGSMGRALIGWSIDGDMCEISIREKCEKKKVNQIKSVATTLFLRVDDDDDDDDDRFHFVKLS